MNKAYVPWISSGEARIDQRRNKLIYLPCNSAEYILLEHAYNHFDASGYVR